MCSISGGFNIPRETIFDMCERQSSRGPDNVGIEQIGNVIFGHNRLAIIDKSERSNQPFIYSDSMLSYNGEIYSYDSANYASDTVYLWSQLGSAIFSNHLDSFLNTLNGMFTFSYYDGDEIILVRDRFGIKPCYYWHDGYKFAFASTPAALTLVKPDWKLSQKGLQEYLSLGGTMLHSMFEGIVAVPPGHYVTFNCKTYEVKTTRWYFPRFIENAIETIKERTREAIVKVRLTCDWPQIVLLSGGIDSSLVSSCYKGQSAIHLNSPEKEYAEEVAKRFEMNLIEVDPTLVRMHEGLTDYSFKSGEPTMAGFIPWITCREISKQGYRVAITANGADELFYGYDRMKNQYHQLDSIFRRFSFFDSTLGPYSLGWTMRPDIRNNKKLWINEAQWTELTYYLMFDLNKTLDFASMCHSVEVRVPYLDHELVEAALSIPMEEHCKQGNKTILKEMLWELGFSREFTDRPKVGFSLHYSPSDQDALTALAMAWYRTSGLPQLPLNSTGRQEGYHQSTVVGLYVWNQIYKLI